MSNNNKPWLLRLDDYLMDDTNTYIHGDYENTEITAADLMSPDFFPKGEVKNLYKLKTGKIKRLESYDFYPCSDYVFLVSTKLKKVMQNLCNPDEIACFPAIISSRYGEKLEAWTVVPTQVRNIVDMEESEAIWWSHGKTIREFPKLRFKNGCMGNSHIIRSDECSIFVLVSDEMKQAIELVNPKSVLFIRDHEYTPE